MAPSGRFDRSAFELGVARLSEHFDVRYDEGIFGSEGYLAGSDERRLRELEAALEDEEVGAIVAARGGFGATRLLGALDVDRIRAADKLLVGFSDITALHGAWARAGVRSIHGPMVAKLGHAPAAQLERWLAVLLGDVPAASTGLEGLAPGSARGPLVGGNLAVLCALVGTRFAPPLDGAVLFVEDVGERPYRVDRMLTQLRQAGWLERVAAVAVGAFTDCAPGTDGVEVEAVLADHLAGLGVPVVSGLSAGHVEDNAPLVLGARVVVDGDAGELRFEEGAT